MMTEAIELEDRAKHLRFQAGLLNDLVFEELMEHRLKSYATDAGSVRVQMDCFAKYRHSATDSIDTCICLTEPGTRDELLSTNRAKVDAQLRRILNEKGGEEAFEDPTPFTFEWAFEPAWTVNLRVRRATGAKSERIKELGTI